MAREDPHFRLRIPESLKAKVEAAAETNKRSMTAEIISRLESSFEGAMPFTDAQKAEIREMLKVQIEEDFEIYQRRMSEQMDGFAAKHGHSAVREAFPPKGRKDA